MKRYRRFVQDVLYDVRRSGRHGTHVQRLAHMHKTGIRRVRGALEALRDTGLVRYDPLAGHWIACGPRDDEQARVEAAIRRFSGVRR